MSNLAICVGINRYPNPANELRGCVNDALDFTELFGRHGYKVKTILDAAATKDRVLTELADAVAAAGFGSRVVFTFSGHGTWVPDYDGDEIDRRDEALCTYDFESDGLILDDELHSTFSGRRSLGGSLLLLDSCHSGTANRFASMTGVVGPGVPKFIPPHTFLADLGAEEATRAEAVVGTKSRPTTSLIAGCSPLEYSYDAAFGGRPNGAFTRAAIDRYAKGMTLNAWYKAIRMSLPLAGVYPQTPELTAASAYRKYSRAL